MTLQELLDELRYNILCDRSDLVAGDADQLWDDTTLVRYIDEAQRRFAVRSFIIRDNSTPEVVNVTLVAGQAEYTLHPAIISVVSARLSTSQVDLIRVGHSVLGSYSNPNTMMPSSDYALMPPGGTVAYTTDETLGEEDAGSIGAVSLRVFPVPAAAQAGQVIKLRVVRKPLDKLTLSAPSAEPEIPEDYHLDMLDWAAYLALRIVDTDAGNPKRAAEFAASFENHVQQAQKLVLRKLFAPRTWGFGRGGWAWGS